MLPFNSYNLPARYEVYSRHGGTHRRFMKFQVSEKRNARPRCAENVNYVIAITGDYGGKSPQEASPPVIADTVAQLCPFFFTVFANRLNGNGVLPLRCPVLHSRPSTIPRRYRLSVVLFRALLAERTRAALSIFIGSRVRAHFPNDYVGRTYDGEFVRLI